MSTISDDNMTIEDLGRGGLKLRQLKDGFRFGTDSVLLAWFTASLVRPGRSSRLLELGSGCGAAALLTCARAKDTVIDCVEIMDEPYEVLGRNISENDLTERIKAFKADIRQLPDEIRQIQYDVVFANPPFYRRDNGPAVPESKKNRLAGRFEENGGLEDFIAAASSRVIPSSGFVVMVMKSDRLSETISLYMKHGLTPTRLMTVHPREDKEATLFLIAGMKTASSAPTKILPPLITHRQNENGDIIETDRLISIYEKEHEDCFIW